MEENRLSQTNLTFTAEETTTLEGYLDEMRHLRLQIDAEQVEIKRLKVENLELKAETRVMLTALKGL